VYVLHSNSLDVDVGDDDGLVVIIRWSSVTGGGQGWCRQRRLDQGCRSMGFLGEDDSHALLLLQERGGGKDPGMGGIVLLLRGGDDNHGIEFLLELSGLDSLAGVVGGHRRWCHSARGGRVDHRRCSRRRKDDRPLGFERSKRQKNLAYDYHVGERRATEY
jgi:hypothetical protein